MSRIQPFSKKRLARIASREERVSGTIRTPSIEKINARDAANREAVLAAIKKSRETPLVTLKESRRLAFNSKTTKAYWMQQADRWFSIFVRLRDSGPEGRGTCVTCSHTGTWRSLQCGHFVTRGHQSTRYDERNSSMQCRGCNYNGGQHLKHAAAIDRKYGEGTAKALQDKGSLRCTRTLSDFQFIADTYKSRVERIRAAEPNKG